MKAKSLAILLLVSGVMANTQKSVIHLNLVEEPKAEAKPAKEEAKAELPPEKSQAKKDAEEVIKEAEASAGGSKGGLRYATNGKLIPGPFGKVEKGGDDIIEGEVDTENGKAKPKKKLNKEEKQEEADLKEHPEKECESLKKSAPGEEVTK